jgi:ADP-heptose:LPS heptosyltransferase
MKRIALVREAGGFGDILCVGAAARALKAEDSNTEIIGFFPESFCNLTRNMEGFDGVVSLGPLNVIRQCRRCRDSALNPEAQPYLKAVFDWDPDQTVDLYCPGYQYEVSTFDICEYSRSQLFALAAGVKDVSQARPFWRPSMEAQRKAETWMKENGVGKNFVGLSLRGTCCCRRFPEERIQKLIELLKQEELVLFDCVTPRYGISPATLCSEDWETFAAVLQYSKLLISVDSGPMHLAAAMNVSNLILFSTTFSAAINTYPYAVALEGTDEKCKLPCHYSKNRGWDRDACRENGCRRMLSLTPEMVFEKAREML